MRINEAAGWEDDIANLEKKVKQQEERQTLRLTESRQSGVAEQQVIGTAEDERSPKFYLRNKVILLNLVLMTYMWTTCSFGYYLIMFQLKYWPGDIYINTIASSVAGVIAYMVSTWIYSRFGLKTSFIGLFSMSVVGGICVLMMGETVSIWMPVFVTFASFGVTGCFMIVYLCMVDVFPTLFVSTAMGVCNFTARVLAIAAPIVAELDPPLPMSLFVGMTFLAVLLTFLIKPVG